MPLALASLALVERDFDLIETVETATKHNFPWVQLHVSPAMHKLDYLSRLAGELVKSCSGIVLHLPSIVRVCEEDLMAAERLVDLLPGKDARVFMLYDNSMSTDNVPQVNGRKVGIENSKVRVFDPVSVLEPMMLAREIGSPFIFDISKIMCADEEHSPQEIISFVVKVLASLKPDSDLVHVAGKSNWTKRFRDYSCVLGSEKDIHLQLIPHLIEFSEKGGVIVFENENIDDVLGSVNAFRPQSY